MTKGTSLIKSKSGRVQFIEGIFKKNYYKKLLNDVEFEQEKITYYGKEYTPHRKIAAYGDSGTTYKYSGNTKISLVYTTLIKELKEKVEKTLDKKFNFVLIQYYPDGDSHISYYSDDESCLVEDGIIASLTFNEKVAREFHLTKKVKKISLRSGMILSMDGDIQKKYLHSIPKRKQVKTGRINLTFRMIKIK